jgi:hypothetical protein
MINFIDLLNWAATIFVWLLGIGIAANFIFPSGPKPRDWAKEEKGRAQASQAWWEAWEAWHAERKRCKTAGLPCPSQGEFMDKVVSSQTYTRL